MSFLIMQHPALHWGHYHGGVGSEQEAGRGERPGTDVVERAGRREKEFDSKTCFWKETKLPQLPLEIALFKMQSADVFR